MNECVAAWTWAHATTAVGCSFAAVAFFAVAVWWFKGWKTWT